MKKRLWFLFVVYMIISLRSEELPPEIKKRFEGLVDFYAACSGGGRQPPGASMFLDYAATNQITQEAVYEIVRRYGDGLCREMQTEKPESDVWRKNALRFYRILNYIEESRDKRWISFLVEKYQSADKITRANVVLAYIGLLGVDSIAFVESSFATGDFKSSAQRRIYRRMQAQLKTANGEEREKMLGFFLRRMENTDGVGDQEELDQILTSCFSEYRVSVQRRKYAERFLKSDFGFARKRGKETLLEVGRIPVEQRRDLSELLQNSADEVKPPQ